MTSGDPVRDIPLPASCVPPGARRRGVPTRATATGFRAGPGERVARPAARAASRSRAGEWMAWLLALAALALGAAPAQAQDCSDYGGVLDGAAGDVAPSQLQVDMNCTIRNFPASNPLRTNFSFYTQPGQNPDRWLIVFDNVVHTGQMSCNSVLEHKIWFTNGSSTAIQEGCQNLLIPVEKIDKENPDGQTTAAVGVPFTYRLTMPVLFDAGTGTVINNAGSLNDLHSVTLTDDLNATGADLTYVSHTAYWEDTGAPVPHSFSNVGGLLTFDGFPVIPAGEQIVIELTVVLDNTPANAIGTTFFNTAKWEFGRLIEGVFYEPLPGEWGITAPMAIVGPELALTKTGPAFLNLGESGEFTLDVVNTGSGEAWDATIVDRLPDGASGGMCDAAPTVLGAQVYQADGVTPVAGKGPLVAGTDFSVGYTAAPACELTLTMLSADGAIGPGERLIVRYQAQLDADTANGAALINVAGVTGWFNGDSSNPGRQTYTRVLTDGTPGTLDHEDAHSVVAALTGFFFEKTVANVTSGADPTASAEPGDTLRYSLRLRTTDTPLAGAVLVDDLGALNPEAVFLPGSLTLVSATVPAGADAGNTDPNGGTNGAGRLDIRNLNMPADDEIVIQFDVALAPRIADGTVVLNQSRLTRSGGEFTLSDDPNVNGRADPDVDGDEDPTQLRIESAPYFDVDKVSSYVSGDPNVLLAGETLRYTITVRNVGTDDAFDAVLRDEVPANTSYVAGSTTLNGSPVPDGPSGISPLSSGLAIHAPGEPTPGLLRADASGAAAATIVFDVVVDPDLVDGTVISNQAFVSALGGGVADQPSDDPRTPPADDPTRDVVGNVPLIYAEKSAALEVDQSSPGIVDPGDVLRYTITVYNNGPVDATDVVLRDAVPTHTTYVADSTTVNGIAVGPDEGVSPLVAGLPISSSDLTPPLPGAGAGTLTPREAAVIEFHVRVDDGVPTGTLITNQASVETDELPNVPTDGDGNAATGPEPTVVVVGPRQELAISKQVAVVGGGAAEAGATLEYTVRVLNIGSVPATYVVVYDDLDMPVEGQLEYVDQSATLNGSTTGVTFAGSTLTADYGASYGDLAPGAEAVLRFRAVLYAELAIGTAVTNTAEVRWNDPPQTRSASVTISVGGMIGIGILSGAVWHDADFDDVKDDDERELESWGVELYRNGELLHSRLTDADGAYRINGIPPNYETEDVYELRFVAPGAGASTALLGLADSDFTDYLQRIADIVVQSGGNLQNLNLPIDPNGVVYNSMGRAPIAGAVLTLLDAANGAPVPPGCFDDAAQQDQVTLADGWYKFDLNFSDPACPTGGDYLIRVTAPSSDYVAGYSEMIPPTSGPATGPFSVPSCPGGALDAIPGTAQHCEAVASASAPAASVAARSAGTVYHVMLTLDDGQPPGSSQIFNNHIPLDPELADSVSITKTTPVLNVTRGQLVPYTITVTNDAGFDLADVSIVDRFPAGFRYVQGSARIDSTPAEPVVNGRELVWSDLGITGAGRRRLQLLLAVGSGVSEGDFVNRAQVVHSLTGNALSNEASATVRLVPDPDFDCTDVMGKVFDDRNRNGVQDQGEAGLPGVRLVTATGLAATTDGHGRFHITCATVPHESRGSNFVVKLDDRTLPTGFRASMEPVRVGRATRGKALRFNFGASIHRVVGLDISDPVFRPGETELRPQWKPRIGLLVEELSSAPAVLRLSYLADVEDPKLVDERLEAIEREIVEAWEAMDCCYELEIEPEIFWRRGAPPEQPVERTDGR
ncbi:MAG: DUF11 domain-containing protein [Gammaproteobacteria bacterium]|nr:DUF11 domain-containing protein [Gammaproteobacteria bacterium]